MKNKHGGTPGSRARQFVTLNQPLTSKAKARYDGAVAGLRQLVGGRQNSTDAAISAGQIAQRVPGGRSGGVGCRRIVVVPAMQDSTRMFETHPRLKPPGAGEVDVFSRMPLAAEIVIERRRCSKLAGRRIHKRRRVQHRRGRGIAAMAVQAWDQMKRNTGNPVHQWPWNNWLEMPVVSAGTGIGSPLHQVSTVPTARPAVRRLFEIRPFRNEVARGNCEDRKPVVGRDRFALECAGYGIIYVVCERAASVRDRWVCVTVGSDLQRFLKPRLRKRRLERHTKSCPAGLPRPGCWRIADTDTAIAPRFGYRGSPRTERLSRSFPSAGRSLTRIRNSLRNRGVNGADISVCESLGGF